jgi:hypothetical protein
MVIIGRDIKLRLLLVILSVIILFPDTSYAHVTRLFDGFAIGSPFIILIVNFFKFLIISQFKPHTNTKSLFNSILYVVKLPQFSGHLEKPEVYGQEEVFQCQRKKERTIAESSSWRPWG